MPELAGAQIDLEAVKRDAVERGPVGLHSLTFGGKDRERLTKLNGTVKVNHFIIKWLTLYPKLNAN
jgi:hypothetical protein